MVRGSAVNPLLEDRELRELEVAQPPPGLPPIPPEGDPSPSWPPPRREPVVSNARLGMLMFLAFEAMFFGGLIGAFLVFRLASLSWPPPGQPYLPVAVTWINTGVLLSSAFTMRRAVRAIRDGNRPGFQTYLAATATLGVIFLAVQGSEWVRLVRFGFRLSSGTYGATFYTLIGCHGVHVLGAVIWLLIVLLQATGARYSPDRHIGVQLCSMYWQFVVALWPVLFGLVYLY